MNSSKMVRLWRISILLFLCFALMACNTPAIYQDEDFNPPVYWGYHKVREGESISSIAWRYSRDYRELADANGLKPPFTLSIGQIIRLDLIGDENAFKGNAVISSIPAGGKRAKSEISIKQRPEKYQKVVVSNLRKVGSIEWQWPANGTVIKGFGNSTLINKGVDIAGNLGDPIYASADGRVVYSGGGVVGYGNLVIIEHDGGYLSAYAHNQDIYVNAGEQVSRGMVIASMGRVGTDRVKLHFEIRNKGVAKDPSNYLPK